ncbi:unnamed protein product [Linum trigynum]|uniref:Uncharacterized protein n=1 Tax=Linum trigynum TaxID=586398 RepID=A0AAV2EID9_9ROSI
MRDKRPRYSKKNTKYEKAMSLHGRGTWTRDKKARREWKKLSLRRPCRLKRRAMSPQEKGHVHDWEVHGRVTTVAMDGRKTK